MIGPPVGAQDGAVDHTRRAEAAGRSPDRAAAVSADGAVSADRQTVGRDGHIVARIERALGIPGLVDLLADRIPASDLQSLLLAVYRRRAAKLSPAVVRERYARDRFSRPSPLDPRRVVEFDRVAFDLLASAGFQGVELSPVNPLGTVSAVATVDQNNVLSTTRNSEVLSDSTNSLALESALRRRVRLAADHRDAGPVRLYASHRLVRGQAYQDPALRPHFRMLALTTAGRDTGSFRFETDSLYGQLDVLLRILHATGDPDRPVRGRVALTDLTGGTRRDVLRRRVIAPLLDGHPDVEITFADSRTAGRGYYVDTCFHIHAETPSGAVIQIADGGFTTWTRALSGNAKERLLIGSLGVELLLSRFIAPTG